MEHVNASDYSMAQLVSMYKKIDPEFSLDRFRTKEAGAAKINGYFYNSQHDSDSDNFGENTLDNLFESETGTSPSPATSDRPRVSLGTLAAAPKASAKPRQQPANATNGLVIVKKVKIKGK